MYVDDLMAKHLAAVDPHSQYAPKDSPTLTGMPKTPTPPAGNNSTLIASTAFVQAAILALIGGAPATLDTLKKIASAINNDPNFSTTINNALALKAPLASPALTGTPTAPTAVQSTNNTQIATTAFVKSAVAGLVGSSPEALDTLNELAAALGNDPNFATTVMNALAGKQPLDATLTNLSGKSGSALLQYLGIVDATTSQKGIVRLNGGVTDADDTLGATSGAVKLAYDAAMAAANIAKDKWTSVDASTLVKGIVQLNAAINSTSTTQAATPSAVKQAYDAATDNALGKGQKLQNFMGARGTGVTYTNSTG
ncbi:phage tail fiber protein [Citrobacter freundii]|nr:phage tail fiber protein [Citrobacter freundii]